MQGRGTLDDRTDTFDVDARAIYVSTRRGGLVPEAAVVEVALKECIKVNNAGWLRGRNER